MLMHERPTVRPLAQGKAISVCDCIHPDDVSGTHCPPRSIAEALHGLEELAAVLIGTKTDVFTLRLLPLTTLDEFRFFGHLITKAGGGFARLETTLHEDAARYSVGEAGFGLVASDRLIDATLVICVPSGFLAFFDERLSLRQQRVLITREPIDAGANNCHDQQQPQDDNNNQGFGPTWHLVPPLVVSQLEILCASFVFSVPLR